MGMRTVILATWLALTCMLAPRATLAQGEFRSSHFQTSDGVELHYLEAGSGPTLVFVPGWTLGAALEALDRPVLLIFSSLDWAVAEAEIVREQWPELRVEVIENTSHVLFVDEPQRFNGVLEEFLATLPEQ